MSDYDMRCSDENAREYVKYSVYGGNSVKKVLPLSVCAGLVTAMLIMGIIGFFMTQNPIMLVVSGCALVVGIGIFLFMHFLIGSTATKLREAYSKQEGLVCSVSESSIVIVRDNRPVRVIEWRNVTELVDGKTAFFIMEGDSTLMILGKDKLLSGSIKETSEIIAKKSGEKD